MTAIDRMVAVACEKVMGNLRGQESIETFNRAMEVLRLSMINAYVEKTPACRPKDPPIPTSPCVPESKKPKKGEPFICPICRKRSIVGVTAKIVADHDHHTGNIRDFICDSCNTGLGRFKNGENYLLNALNYIKEKDTLKH